MQKHAPAILLVDPNPVERDATAHWFYRRFPHLPVHAFARGDAAETCAKSLLGRDASLELLLVTEYPLPDDDSGLRLIAAVEKIGGDRVETVIFTKTSLSRLVEICEERHIAYFHKTRDKSLIRRALSELLDP